MSKLNIQRIQFGSDANANNNFYIEQPATPDGTLRIYRGNVGAPVKQLLQINADGGVNMQGPMFSAFQAEAGNSVAANTWTKQLFNSEEFDSSNCFASSRFTPNVAGYYLFNAQAVWAQATSGQAIMSIWKNGTDGRRGSSMPLNSTISVYTNVSSLIYMNGTTDYVEVYVQQTSGGAININGGNSAYGYFQGHLVKAA